MAVLMAWSSAFLTACAERTGAVCFIFRTAKMNEEPSHGFTVASVGGLGLDVRIPSDGVRMGGSRLSPRGWSTSIGAWSVDLLGDLDFTVYLTRGTVVELLVGFAGWAASDYEPVALGQVRNVRGKHPRWTIDIDDLFAVVRQPLSTSQDLTGSGLFLLTDAGGVPIETTIATAAYVVGDATLNVASTSGFVKATTGPGAIKVTPDAGDPFYLTYTGTTGTTFTGCSSTGAMGTTAGASAIGNRVQHVAYLAGSPFGILRHILVSGAPASATYGDYPSAWGLNINENYLDHDDIDEWKAALEAAAGGANYRWKIVAAETQYDAYSYLTAKMALFGLFFAVRQGLLTIRAAQGSAAGAGLRISPVLAITDDDIAEVLDYEAFEGGHNPEYVSVYLTNTATSVRDELVGGTDDVATLPRGRSLYYESTLIWESNADTDAVLAEVGERVSESAMRIPERVSLRLVSLRCAKLAVGDCVNLTTTRVQSRRDGATGFYYRNCIVDEVSPAWPERRVVVGLLIYPESEDAFA